MLKKEFVISLIGGIWALVIFLSSLFGWYFFNYFNYSYLIIGVGAIIGVIIGLRYNEQTGNIICICSCIGFMVFQFVITWGYFPLYWIFISGGANYAPLTLLLIGGIFGYAESRKINQNQGIKREGKKMLTRGLKLSLIGGIMSWFIITFIYPMYDYYRTHAFSFLILSWGAIIGVIVGLLYNDRVGSIICIGSGIIYVLYLTMISGGIFFVNFFEPLSYNLTPLILVLIGGLVGYSESPKLI